jgi:SHS2 domain-containing protein
VGFELLEHTADVGLRVTAPSLEQLFADAGGAVGSLIIENPEAIETRQRVQITLEAENVEDLFIDWLRELIFTFETRRLLFREFSIEISDANRRLLAECRGEPADWSRHLPDNELKAATYHRLRVEQTPTGWEAEVIFDI